MPFANHTAMDYLPRRLHPQEYGDPFRVINLFLVGEIFLAGVSMLRNGKMRRCYWAIN